MNNFNKTCPSGNSMVDALDGSLYCSQCEGHGFELITHEALRSKFEWICDLSTAREVVKHWHATKTKVSRIINGKSIDIEYGYFPCDCKW